MLNGLMKSNGWFPTMFDDFFNTDFMPRANSTAPAVNVKAIEKGGTQRPGEFLGGYQQEHKHEDSHRHYLRREFSYSNYEQNYVLPDDVVKDQISAKVEDGILTITMPKTEPKEKVTKAIEVS